MERVLQFFHAGGFVMYPLAILSLTAVFVIVERLLAYRSLAHTAPGLLNKVADAVRNNDFAGARKLCDGVPGPVAASLATALDSRGANLHLAEGRVQETGEEFFVQMERFLPVLDTTTTISPLLGLLGTIVGMIGTFQAVANAKTAAATDAVLAGVGEALYATATGLTIAVICFVTYNYFAARQKAAVGETEIAATKLINLMMSKGELVTHEV